MQSGRFLAATLLLLSSVFLFVAFHGSQGGSLFREPANVGRKLSLTPEEEFNDDEPENVGNDDYIPVRKLEDDEFANLRILTLGTSRTAGKGLHRHLIEKYTYPYLLSPDTNNLAVEAANPDYPAFCTFSMVGDEIYDVIVVEFYLLSSNTNMLRLVKRLRHRFPDAQIIFLRTWLPSQFHQPVAEEEARHLLDLMGLHERFLEIEEDSAAMEELIGDIRATGAHIWELPQPDSPDVPEKLYQTDQVNFRWKGHKYIADGIRDIIRNSGNVVRSDNVNPWSHLDTCSTWYSTGESPVPHNAEMEMIEFASGKYALEARADSNWLLINNNLGKDAHVYLQHMALGRPSYPVYGETIVAFPHWSSGVLIDGNDAPRKHVTQLQYIGVVPEGYKFLMVYPTSWNHRFPFRATGLIVTSKEEIPSP